MYTTTFTLDSVDSTKDYILKLGTLYGVPEISVNGSEFEAVSMAPYELDISQYVKAGENTVTVKLVVPLRNRLIGYAANGEDGNGLNKEHYAQFAGKTLAKSGMTAPGSVVAVRTDRDPVVDPSSSEVPDSSDPSTPDSSSSSSSGTDAPNTGDQAPVMMMAVLLLASGAAAFVLIRRRKA